ncbi:MAG: isoprenyl transferase [Clostridia bacterium]
MQHEPLVQGTPAAESDRVRHLAIIMDGNRRWAVRQGLLPTDGHRAGIDALRRCVRAAPDLGIEILTVYAFSTENWRRSKLEVDMLMALLVEFLERETPELMQQGVSIRTIGEIDRLPALQQRALARAMAETAGGNRLVLNLALNYGGRSEIVRACRVLAEAVAQGHLSPEHIDETRFAAALDTGGLPDPDLLIRASGEERLSNFLLWQLAYTELWVTETLWPDFDRSHLEAALKEFATRERRYGGTR